MFTGIIEALGKVEKVERERGNMILTISSPVSGELKVDQSVSHNGACLTVVACDQRTHRVVLIDETLRKTNFDEIQEGDEVNLERCLSFNGRLDGHLVQGHVDLTGTCVSVEDQNGSWKYTVHYAKDSGFVTVPKGSVCLNGISLTVVDSFPGGFSVAIIPYTFEHTTMKQVQKGSKMNIEFDIIGKYIARYAELYKS